MTRNIPSQLLDRTKDKKVIEKSSFEPSSYSSDDFERAGVWYEPDRLSIESQFKGISEVKSD